MTGSRRNPALIDLARAVAERKEDAEHWDRVAKELAEWFKRAKKCRERCEHG